MSLIELRLRHLRITVFPAFILDDTKIFHSYISHHRSNLHSIVFPSQILEKVIHCPLAPCLEKTL